MLHSRTFHLYDGDQYYSERKPGGPHGGDLPPLVGYWKTLQDTEM